MMPCAELPVAAASKTTLAEDNAAGVVKYGVANYEPRKTAAAPVRPPQPVLCLAPVPPH